jgi:uncharacterized protein
MDQKRLNIGLSLPSEAIELSVPEEIRARTARKLNIPLAWDVAIDSLPSPKLNKASALLVHLCRFYRRARPKSIGNRCAYEPSCSRYAELAVRLHGAIIGTRFAIKRLRECNAHHGGVNLPPGVSENDITRLETLL